MSTDLVTIPATATLDEAQRLLEHQHVRHLPVVDERGALAGMLSDRDLRGARAGTVADAITGDLIVAGVDDELCDVARLMVEHRVGAVPVVDDRGRAVGIVSYVDALRAMADEIEQAEDEDLMEVIELPEAPGKPAR